MYNGNRSLVSQLRDKISEAEEAKSELDSFIEDLENALGALEELEGRSVNIDIEF